MCIENEIRTDIPVEHLHARLLVVGQKTGRKSDLLQPGKQFSGPLIRRSPVGHECIVNIEYNASVTFFIQSFKRDDICRRHIFIREK